MEYIKRFGKLILSVLCFFVRFILRVLFIVMLAIQLCTIIAVVPFVLILSLVELLTVKPIYYIITGERYADKYNTVINMYGDLMVFGKITWRINDEYWSHDDWYSEKWNSIKNIKVTLYPKKEEE